MVEGVGFNKRFNSVHVSSPSPARRPAREKHQEIVECHRECYIHFFPCAVSSFTGSTRSNARMKPFEYLVNSSSFMPNISSRGSLHRNCASRSANFPGHLSVSPKVRQHHTPVLVCRLSDLPEPRPPALPTRTPNVGDSCEQRCKLLSRRT